MTNIPGAKLSLVQEAVQIVQNIVQCGMDPSSYADEIQNLHCGMAAYALDEVRKAFPGYIPKEVGYQGLVEEVEFVCRDEVHPAYETYWAATSTFFRKVYQAAAAAA